MINTVFMFLISVRCFSSSSLGIKKYGGKISSVKKPQLGVLTKGDLVTITVNGIPAKTQMSNTFEYPLSKHIVPKLVLDELAGMGVPVVKDLMCATIMSYRAIDDLNDQKKRAEAISKITEYGRTDTVSYQKRYPSTLVRLQDEYWIPILRATGNDFKEEIKVFYDTYLNSRQDERLISKYKEYLSDLDNFKLASFEKLAMETKSFIIPYSFLENKMDANHDDVGAALLEIKYQECMWGSLEGVHDLEIARLKYIFSICKCLWQNSE